MSKENKRSRRAMGQFSAHSEELNTSTTIVGGQPPRRKHVTVNVPVGVERALLLAARDATFREELLRDRDAAVIARGMTLRPSEAALLRAAPDVQLEAFVNSLDLSPANVRRRTFMGAVAASAAALAVGCSDDDVKTDIGGGLRDSAGVRTDGIPLQSDGVHADAGVRDQLPLDLPRYHPDMGILPDTLPADVPVVYPDAGVPVDVPTAYPDAGVPVDVPMYNPDMGIKPDSSSD